MAGGIFGSPYAPASPWFQQGVPAAPAPAPAAAAPAGTAPKTPRYRFTAQGGVFQVPEGVSDEDANEMLRRWDEHVATLEKAANEGTEFDRAARLRQLEDVKEGRDNAYKIAQLSNSTSRYGTDVQAKQQMADLKERQRQYDLTHGLDLERIGLDRAKTATDYLSTPDRYVQAGDFLDLSGQVMAGGGGASYQGGRAQPKTMQDFAVLQSGGNPGRQIGQPGAGGAGGGTDPRVKAATDLMKQYGPSDGYGHDQNSYAVLDAAKQIFALPSLTPGQQKSIRSSPQYQQMLSSAGGRLGENVAEWQYQNKRSLPGQGSVRAA